MSTQNTNDVFTVVGNIPIPSKAVRSKYPFATMKVGDSFDIGDRKPKSTRDAACRYARKHGGKFLVGKAESIMVKGYRCWKVK